MISNEHPVLVSRRGQAGLATAIHPDPKHPSWAIVHALLLRLPEPGEWTHHVSPATTTRDAS